MRRTLAAALALAVLPAALPAALAGPAAAEPPTTVAGLLLHYQELSRRAEKEAERLLWLRERAERGRAATDAYRSEAEAAVAGGGPGDLVHTRADRMWSRAAVTAEDTSALLREQEALTAALAEETALVKDVLSALPPAQRSLLSAVGPEPSSAIAAVPPSAEGRGPVVAFALAQLGKPYEWGAVGPDAYDCSGLVLAAFASAGVRVPRVSVDQSRAGVPVARDEVRPGDLVFYYQPVHHVAIALDRDRVVHAATFGEPVKVSTLDGVGPVTAIRRLAV